MNAVMKDTGKLIIKSYEMCQFKNIANLHNKIQPHPRL